jgi:hypothetical protein
LVNVQASAHGWRIVVVVVVVVVATSETASLPA